MRLFLGLEGKQEIIAAIIKTFDELKLEEDDQIYFHIEKKSDHDNRVEELDKAYGKFQLDSDY